jgi:hypothetical protein
LSNEISVKNDYSEQFENLMSKIVSSFVDKEETRYKAQEKIITDAYMEVLNYGGDSAPDFSEIVLNIEERNSDILAELAAMDMECGMMCPEHSHQELTSYFMGPAEDEEDNLYSAYLSAWYEEYSAEFRYELPYFISTVLEELGFCYLISDEADGPKDYQYGLSNNFAIYVNDAQNLLLQDWHLKILAGDRLGNYSYTQQDIENLLNIRFDSKPERG